MPGFFDFDVEEFDANSKYDYTKMEADSGCMQCGMFKTNKNPQLQATGEGRLKCLIVAEANGPDEDKIGTQLVGNVGQFFRNRLALRGLELERDFKKINAVNCCPYAGESFREPKDEEIQLCRPFVEKAIQEFKPQYIWIMGRAALNSFYMDYFGKCTMSMWRGNCIPDSKYQAYIIATAHPSWGMRLGTDNKPNEASVYDRDLDFAVSCLNKPAFGQVNLRANTNLLYNYQDVINCLDRLNQTDGVVTFDYETTGLKPFATGHKIACISFATPDGKSYSFPLDYKDHFTEDEKVQIRKRWKKFLISDIQKTAHNIQFEHLWSRHILGVEVNSWVHCSMLAAHVLDSRSGITSLDFQNYKNFGIYPYSGDIGQYLRADNSNAFNNIMKANLEKLLDYSVLDSKWANRLFMRQDVELEERSKRVTDGGQDIIDAFYLLMNGALQFSKMTSKGTLIKEEYYNETRIQTRERIANLEHKLIHESKNGIDFKTKFGRDFDPQKDVDKKLMFYDIIGVEEQKTTKGNLSVSKKALASMDSDFIRLYQKINQLKDIDNKYIAQFLREVTFNKIHPFFHLHLARTYRSSSSDPNWQNIPVHDEDAKKACRSGVFPSPGNKLMEWDFGGIEVCAGCFYHKDPQMITYVTDKSTDMHRDSAMDIAILPQHEITKEIRFYCGKNGWVFPQFYGSYYVSCAKEIWREIHKKKLKTTSEVLLSSHLDTKGIRNYHDFEEHCKHVERKFWEERFPVYNEWKKKINAEYRKNGFITSLFGFEFGGILGINDCTNHQIQGTAFHMLLWTIIEVAIAREIEGWGTGMLAQIHDSGLEDLIPGEQAQAMRTIHHIGTHKIRETFDWINVPLTIEFEETEIDAPWSSKKEMDPEVVKQILN